MLSRQLEQETKVAEAITTNVRLLENGLEEIRQKKEELKVGGRAGQCSASVESCQKTGWLRTMGAEVSQHGRPDQTDPLILTGRPFAAGARAVCQIGGRLQRHGALLAR